jgi:hypothetical protein
VIKRNFVVGISDIDILLLSYYPYGPDDAAVLVRKIDQRGTTISALFALTQNRQRTRALCQLILSSFSVLNYSEYMKLCFNVIILRLFYVVFIILVLWHSAVLS